MWSLGSLYRRFIFRLSISPFLWVLGLFLLLASCLHTVLFTGGFFSFFPGFSIVLIPAVASILPGGDDRLSLPISDLAASFAQVLSLASVQVFFLLFTVPATFWMPAAGSVEGAAVATGYAVLVLYVASASALCTFFFSLLQNRGTAFASSSLVLALFSYAHVAAQYVGLPRFVSSFLMALSFSWHADAASKGVLDSRDIFFYISAFLFFSCAAAAAMQWRRGNSSWNFRRLVALVLAALILLVLDSNIYYARLDVTKGKRFSVSRYSSSLLAELDSPLSISYYRSSSLRRLYPQVRDVEDFIRLYAESAKGVEFELLDPAEKGLEGRLEGYGIRGQDIELSSASGKILSKVFSAVAISYKGNTEVIPFVMGVGSLEYDLTVRIQSLLRGRKSGLCIIAGNGLSVDGDYPQLLSWLSLQGFSVREESPAVLDNGGLDPIGGDCLLLLGSSELSLWQAQAVLSYIDGGGKAFIATTPYTVAVEGDWSASESGGMVQDELVRLLMKYGIYFKDGMTASSSCFQLTMMGEGDTSKVERLDYPLWPSILPQEDALNGLSLFWPCAVELDGEVAEQEGLALVAGIRTSGNSWQSGGEDGKFITNPFSVSPSALPGEEEGSFTLSACAYRDGKPALYVLGDQYAPSSRMLAFASGPSGAIDTRMLEFISDGILRLEGQGELVKLKHKGERAGTALENRAGGEAYSLGKALFVCLAVPLLLMLLLFVAVRAARERFGRKLLLTWGKSS
ncbi:MAG: GldG family protein [Treponema sp.]|nr:GldG family protein [Treponema sp.]